MSTRALIIRKSPNKNAIQFGHVYFDGQENTGLLNNFWREPEKVDELFARLTTCEISELGYDMESTTWRDDIDKPWCGEKKVVTWGQTNQTNERKLERFFHKTFEYLCYVSVFYEGNWYDFYVEDESDLYPLAQLLTIIQNPKAKDCYSIDFERRFITEPRRCNVKFNQGWKVYARMGKTIVKMTTQMKIHKLTGALAAHIIRKNHEFWGFVRPTEARAKELLTSEKCTISVSCRGTLIIIEDGVRVFEFEDKSLAEIAKA